MKQLFVLGVMVCCMIAVSNLAKAEGLESNVIPGFVVDSGEWSLDSKGLKGSSQDNGFYISIEDSYDNFILNYDVQLEEDEPYSVSTVAFRIQDQVYSSYGLSVDVNSDVIRFFDFDGSRTISTYGADLETGVDYRLKIIAEDSCFLIYLNGKQVIEAVDTAYNQGSIGLNVYNGTVYYNNVNIYQFNTNVSGFSSEGGQWEKSVKGLTATAIENGFYIMDNGCENFILSGDLTVDQSTPYGTAKLIFRAQDSVYESYAVDLDPNMNRIRLFDFAHSRDISVYNTDLFCGQTYNIRIVAMGRTIKVYLDGVMIIEAEDSAHSGGRWGLSLYNGTSHFQNVTFIDIDSIEDLEFQCYDRILAKGNTDAIEVVTEISGETYNLLGAVAYSSSDSKVISVNNIGDVTAEAAQGEAVITATLGDLQTSMTVSVTDFSEALRPQVHFSPRSDRMFDVRGVYYNREYHLFHQGSDVWGHAVSSDLVTWKHLPVALESDENGAPWSGSVVVDEHNYSGLFENGSGLVAYYTANYDGLEQVCIAYSKDDGRNWSGYDGNPVIRNVTKALFRDPKVLWYEPESKWVMVIACTDKVRFYSSTDMVSWSYMSEFGATEGSHAAIWECPDLFEVAVDDDRNVRKWVLMVSQGNAELTDGSRMQYFVGTFDGTSFVNDNSSDTVLWMDYGNDLYGSITFSNIPDNRRIFMGWMGNWKYPHTLPTMPQTGNATVPREIFLRTQADGSIRMIQSPIEELSYLRDVSYKFPEQLITPGSNILSQISGNSVEIIAEFTLDSATEFGFNVRQLGGQQTTIGYDVAEEEVFVDRSRAGLCYFSDRFTGYHKAPMASIDNKVRFRIIVDDGCVEVYANDGQVVFSSLAFPETTRDGLELYAIGGCVKLTALEVYHLKSIWGNSSSGDKAKEIRFDSSRIDVPVDGSRTVYTQVLPVTAENKELIWSIEDPSVVNYEANDDRSITLTAGRTVGKTVLTATTTDASIVAQIKVNVCAFNTNIDDWPEFDENFWAIDACGVRGRSGPFDSFYYAPDILKNFSYEGRITVDESSEYGAGVLVFRAAEKEDKSGYGLALDPNSEVVKLFDFNSGTEIDSYWVPIERGMDYGIKVIAVNDHIQVFLDDDRIMNVYDSTYSSGRVGLCVFNGMAYFQDIYTDETVADASK